MKKVLVFILMIVAFVACSKDDNDSENSIKKATVKGAQLIYQNSVESRAGTRATTEEVQRFMTVDYQGNIKPIRFITKKGDTLDMRIDIVKNLSNEYLALSGNFIFNNVALGSLLVNKNTELIYAMNIHFMEMGPVFEDNDRNIYTTFASTGGGENTLYRLNTSNPDNITMEEYATKLSFRIGDYWINKNSFCYYIDDIKRIKCPGGKVYELSSLLPNGYSNATIFSGINGKFYVACTTDNFYIYVLEENGNNGLKAIEVANLPGSYYCNGDFCPNQITKEHICNINNEKIIIFNEETNELKMIDIQLPTMDYIAWGRQSTNTFVTSESLWILDETVLYQLRFSDYTLNTINLGKIGYGVNKESISCSINAPGLSFSGLRYSDGQNIVGTINEDGTITTFEKTKTSNKITTLLRLN